MTATATNKTQEEKLLDAGWTQNEAKFWRHPNPRYGQTQYTLGAALSDYAYSCSSVKAGMLNVGDYERNKAEQLMRLHMRQQRGWFPLSREASSGVEHYTTTVRGVEEPLTLAEAAALTGYVFATETSDDNRGLDR